MEQTTTQDSSSDLQGIANGVGERQSVAISIRSSTNSQENEKIHSNSNGTEQPASSTDPGIPTDYHSDELIRHENGQDEGDVVNLTAEEANPREEPNGRYDNPHGKSREMAFHSSEFRMEKALNEDIYSILYTADLFSIPFFFALFVFWIQFTILTLIFTGLVDTTDDPPSMSNGQINRLRIPVDVEQEVRIAQICGVILIINFAAEGGDFVKGCDRIFNGYDQELNKEHPGATKLKWAVSGIFQAASGFFMITNLFLLLMTSTDVVGLCLNFAALHFVQDIDDVAFSVAEMGLVGSVIQEEVRRVGDIMTSASMKNRTLGMRKLLMLVLVTGLYSFFFVFASWQWSGKFNCSALLVQFGDAYDPDLAHYSGVFLVKGSYNDRAKYVDTTETIRLTYSRTDKAWVFEPNNEEESHVIIKSSETETFDVTSIASQTWFHNTNAGFVPVDWLALRCNECNDSVCPSERGTCVEDHVCECNDGYIGESCAQAEPSCEWYGIDFRTKGTLPNTPGGSFFFENAFAPVDNSQFYGRSVYIPVEFNSIGLEGRTVQNLMLFTGRRWLILGTPFASSAPSLLNVFDYLNDTSTSGLTDVKILQSLSDSMIFRTFKPLYYSSPVDIGTPSIGFDPTSVTWVFAKLQENPNESDFFGYRPDDGDPLSAKFLCVECSNSTDDGKGNCRNGGLCTSEGFCECLPFYTGYQCEYVYNCNELGCFNGGSCDKITGSCKYCFPGASGNLCQDPLPANVAKDPYFCSDTFVELSKCQNRQHCDPFQLRCQCEPPFYGEFCQNSTQETCRLPIDGVDPCQNGGFCDYSYYHHPICRCPDGFTGDFCDAETGTTNAPQ